MKGDIYLGLSGEEILLSPFGRRFTIEDVEISRTDRTASGRLVRDIIATKKKFVIDYEMIDGPDMQDLLDLYNENSELSLLVYPSGDDFLTTTPAGGDPGYESYTVLMQPMTRERFLITADGMWSGVSVVLEEV